MMGIGPKRAAIEIARLTHWHGERKVARGMLAAAAVGFLALLFAPWQQNATGTGSVIAYSPNERPLSVQAPVDGRVVKWRFKEGDRVKAGQIIVELADNDPRVVERYETERDAAERKVDAARRSIDALRDQLESLGGLRERKIASANAVVRMAENKLEAAQSKYETAVAKAETARLQLKRIRALEAEGLSSGRDLEVAQRNAATAAASLRADRATLESARFEVKAKRADRDATTSALDAKMASARNKQQAARAKLAAAEKALAAAERSLARQDTLDVTAPRTGMLTQVLAREKSAYVKQGEVLAVVVPDPERRAVELFVSGNDAPLIVAGQDVRLQFEGWPAIQFGGWPEAAVGTFSGEVAFVDAIAQPSGRFRVLVLPGPSSHWPRADVLRQGNAANGWVLLSRVSLGYELWRQLNGFPADLPPEAANAGGYGNKAP